MFIFYTKLPQCWKHWSSQAIYQKRYNALNKLIVPSFPVYRKRYRAFLCPKPI